MNDTPENTPQLPHAPNSEAAILGMLIESPDRYWPLAASAQLEVDFFHVPGHRELWQIMSGRHRRGEPTDPVSLRDEILLRKSETLTLHTFSEVLVSELDPSAWDGHIATLRDRLARRIAINASRSAASSDTTGEAAIEALRAASERANSILTGSSVLLDARTAVRDFVANLTEQYLGNATPGRTTGIHYIDQATGGMRPGEFWVVAGRTSKGKSAMMLQFANGAIQDDLRVLIFTLELSSHEIVGRLVACQGKIDVAHVMKPEVAKKGELPMIKRIAEEFAKSKLIICDKSPITIDEITGLAQRVADTRGLDLIVIDYIQLVQAVRIKGQSREQELSAISRSCKQLAKKLKVPVLTASQLNEQGQTRDSRAIEHDADNLFQIVDNGLLAWKLRNGVRNTMINGRFLGKFQRFEFDGMTTPEDQP